MQLMKGQPLFLRAPLPSSKIPMIPIQRIQNRFTPELWAHRPPFTFILLLTTNNPHPLHIRSRTDTTQLIGSSVEVDAEVVDEELPDVRVFMVS